MFGSKVGCARQRCSAAAQRRNLRRRIGRMRETESPPPAPDTDEDAGEIGEAESSDARPGSAEVVATVSDPELTKSRLVVSRRQAGVLWVHEDSGASPALTALSTDGASLATLTLRDASSVDWEDLAIAPCGEADCLWVGDFGDNSERRRTSSCFGFRSPTSVSSAVHSRHRSLRIPTPMRRAPRCGGTGRHTDRTALRADKAHGCDLAHLPSTDK